jgi:hypothetical protein
MLLYDNTTLAYFPHLEAYFPLIVERKPDEVVIREQLAAASDVDALNPRGAVIVRATSAVTGISKLKCCSQLLRLQQHRRCSVLEINMRTCRPFVRLS